MYSNNDLTDILTGTFGIDNKIIELTNTAENQLISVFKNISEIGDYNQLKVLNAMQKNKLSDFHFNATTGYGYNDLGRDALEHIYADIFCTENAIVRPMVISGTHAITAALFGNLRPGDELLSPCGKVYDTLESVIGFTNKPGSFKEYGISFRQVDLLDDFTFDYDNIEKAINKSTKMAIIQRSKGYEFRKAFTVLDISHLIKFIKSIDEKIICMVDNCYGEFVEIIEPSQYGADIMAGSLIKNIGGGLAPVGGYIVGKDEYVINACSRVSAPGLGKGSGPSLGFNGSFLQGLFLAPQVVAGALKGTALAVQIFNMLGYDTYPDISDLNIIGDFTASHSMGDIVAAIKLMDEQSVLAFCEGIQKSAPVDSFVTPLPWLMPGYDCNVVMAAGAFVQGSSIELSADAPMKEPYVVYMQGGLSYMHAKIGILTGINEMHKKGLIRAY